MRNDRLTLLELNGLVRELKAQIAAQREESGKKEQNRKKARGDPKRFSFLRSCFHILPPRGPRPFCKSPLFYRNPEKKERGKTVKMR